MKLGPESEVGLSELLDRILNKGVVVRGEVTISVADVELLYLGLNLLLASTETLALQRERSDGVRETRAAGGSI